MKTIPLQLRAVFVLLLLGILASAAQAQTLPSYVPANGLAGWWPFNGNANDESGNGNNGAVAGATLVADRDGNPSSAYSFDGSSSYIQCVNAGPTGNPTVTASFWLNTATQNVGHIIGWGSDNVFGSDYRVIVNPNCVNAVSFDNFGSAVNYSTTIGTNSWDHYVVVYDSTIGNTVSSASVYRNGVLLTSTCYFQNAAPTNIQALFPITFGRYHGPSYNYFYDGMLDDVGLWNRVLTPCEIQALFQGPGGVTAATASANAVCPGSAATLFASGAATYNWQPGNLSGDSLVIMPAGTTTYTVTGTDSLGCSTVDSVTVIVHAAPLVAANASGNTLCAGDSLTLTGSGAQTYVWDNGVTDGAAFVPAASAVYTVIGTDANSCADTAMVAITVNPLPQLTLSAGTSSYCITHAPGTLNATPAGGAWSGPGVSGNAFDPAAAGAGTHNVIYNYTDGNGCSNADTLVMLVSLCTGIDQPADEHLQFSVFPNPASVHFTIKANAYLVGATYRLYDVSGKEMLSGQLIPETVLLDVSGLPCGMYLLRIGDDPARAVKLIRR